MADAVKRLHCMVMASAVLSGLAVGASLPDPTAPPAPSLTTSPGAAGAAATTAATVGPAVVVQTIVFGPKRHFAIVNGQEVREGGLLEGARVVTITRDTVTLEMAGQRQRFPIHSDVNRQFAINPSAAATPGAGTVKP